MRAANILKGVVTIGSVVKIRGHIVGTIYHFEKGVYYIRTDKHAHYDFTEQDDIEVIALKINDPEICVKYQQIVDECNTVYEQIMERLSREISDGRLPEEAAEMSFDGHAYDFGYDDLKEQLEIMQELLICSAVTA